MEIGYVGSPDYLFDRALLFIVANGAVERFVWTYMISGWLPNKADRLA